MAVWLIRAGAHGEYEQKFIQEKRVYVTWDSLDVNLAKLTDRAGFVEAIQQRYPDTKHKAILNWSSQLWPFAHSIQKGDLVVLPLKRQSAVQIGEVTGDYHFEPSGPSPFYHWRSVKWVGEAVPRTHFGMDLLYTFGAFMTICRVQRNNAETRLAAMRANKWKPESTLPPPPVKGGDEENVEPPVNPDLEQLGEDQISEMIGARFKGHGLTRLVEAILKAEGYTTYLSPEGADGGADILAGAGPLGFGAPRLCVEVKSGDTPADRPTVDKLLGAVAKFGANEGLFVSWSGFKGNVQKELAASFFRVRLWSKKELLAALFAQYEHLDEEMKAELPLKRIWTVAAREDS